MSLQFAKYHGTGNDFILIDDREENFRGDSEFIKKLCDRHFGIGADGLMLLQTAAGFDFRMVYYNADGKESSMCGNGGRCIVAFARKLGLLDTEKASFVATDGPHEAIILHEHPEETQVKLKMIDVSPIHITGDHAFINTGSPHFVIETEQINSLDIIAEGRKIRYSDAFSPGGTNVDFLQYNSASIRVRTYERGVEDETLSCGTGVTAAAIFAAASRPSTYPSPIQTLTLGGPLQVHYSGSDNGFGEIWLEGPASLVFEGKIN